MKYVKMILPILLTAGLLTIALLALSGLVVPKNNTEEAGLESWEAYGFEAEPEGSIDVFILGDSEARTSISPMVLFHDEGITSYCCGGNAQTLCFSEQMLRRILKTQTPKLVILECDVIWEDFSAWEYAYSRVSEWFPVLAWHDRWKHLGKEDFFHAPDYTSVEVLKGYYQTKFQKAAPDSMIDDYMKPDSSLDMPGRMHVWLLEKIASTCAENGIDLLLLATPGLMAWNMAWHNTAEALTGELKEKAAGYGTDVSFIDMNLMTEEIPIDWKKDTRDAGAHLNDYGMEKVCAWFGPWLKEHYALEDHRDDPLCRETWTDLYDEYLKGL